MKFEEIFKSNRKSDKLCKGIAWLLKNGFEVHSYSQDAQTCQFIRRFILNLPGCRGSFVSVAEFGEGHWTVRIRRLTDYHEIKDTGIGDLPANLYSAMFKKMAGVEVDE